MPDYLDLAIYLANGDKIGDSGLRDPIFPKKPPAAFTISRLDQSDTSKDKPVEIRQSHRPIRPGRRTAAAYAVGFLALGDTR